jgi:hypothetical protein
MLTLNDFKMIFVLLCHHGGCEGIWLGAYTEQLFRSLLLAARHTNAKSETMQRKHIVKLFLYISQ